MADKRDYYDVLGIDKNASDKEIKSAFRKKAMKYHPDKNPDNKKAEESFKEVNEAYGILSDSEKKNKYDRFGHAGVDPSAGFGGGGGFSGGGFEDIFDMFGGMFGGNRSGYSQHRRNGPTKGQDLQKGMTITFREAAFGVSKTIKMKKNVTCDKCEGVGAAPGTSKKTCPSCNGSGEVHTVQQTPFGNFQSVAPCPDCNGAGQVIETPCPDCRGTGQVKKEVTIKVKIPAGVDNDAVVPIRGQGLPGKNGGPTGDLYIVISVKSDNIFKREGSDLYLEIPISFEQAALGDNLVVPSLEEKISYKIPEGTQSATIFRLKGKGVISPRNGKKGDLYVKVIIEIPTKLNRKQKKAVEEMGQALDNSCYQKKSNFFDSIKDLFK